MKIPEANMAMSHHMEIIEDKDEGGYVIYYPDLPGCITCSKTTKECGRCQKRMAEML